MFPLRRSDPTVKKTKPVLRECHTAFTKHGMGDYLGQAAKNPIGKVRDVTVGFRPVTPKQLKTKPKSVV